MSAVLAKYAIQHHKFRKLFAQEQHPMGHCVQKKYNYILGLCHKPNQHHHTNNSILVYGVNQVGCNALNDN